MEENEKKSKEIRDPTTNRRYPSEHVAALICFFVHESDPMRMNPTDEFKLNFDVAKSLRDQAGKIAPNLYVQHLEKIGRMLEVQMPYMTSIINLTEMNLEHFLYYEGLIAMLDILDPISIQRVYRKFKCRIWAVKGRVCQVAWLEKCREKEFDYEQCLKCKWPILYDTKLTAYFFRRREEYAQFWNMHFENTEQPEECKDFLDRVVVAWGGQRARDIIQKMMIKAPELFTIHECNDILAATIFFFVKMPENFMPAIRA
jgi:hypothetical protein